MNVKRKKRILALVQLPPPIHGAALRNKDFVKSEYLSKDVELDFVAIQTASSVGDIGDFTINKIFKILKIFTSAFVKIIYKKPDFSYITLSATGFGFYKDIFLISILKIFKIPITIHMRNRGLSNTIHGHRERFRKIFVKVLTDCHFIVMSNYLKKDVDFIHENNITVIDNCLTYKGYKPSLDELIKRFKKKNIIYLSNITESKGSILLLDIVAELNKKILNSPLPIELPKISVYGPFFTKEEEDKFKVKLKALALENIVLEGAIHNEEKFEALKNASLMLFPTQYDKECFPGVVMEAQSVGLPVVASNIAALPEMIFSGVNGYTVDSISEYVEAVLSIINNEDRYIEFSQSSFLNFESRFKAKVVHPQILKVVIRES